VLLDLIAPDGDIGSGYRHLAELVLRGLMRRLSRMYSTIAIGTATGNAITIIGSSSGIGLRRMAE
jgi:Na+/H+ antiporter NhaD/arsenite permease-like protein